MIKIENTEVFGFEAAVRGCRNSWGSHEKSDSFYDSDNAFNIGKTDLSLLLGLVKAGDSHAKCMRMVTAWFDLTAPRFFWSEFDTYHHVVRCSESTMHTITKRDLEKTDFSFDHYPYSNNITEFVLQMLYNYRVAYQEEKAKGNTEQVRYWWRKIIELLPQSYNQKSTICTNYQELRNMYHQRKGHRLSEWQEFREWCETLPYSELITAVSGREEIVTP